MNPKISYNPDNIHVWVNLPDLLKLVDLFIRRGFLKEAATCCQLLDHARKDPDVQDFTMMATRFSCSWTLIRCMTRWTSVPSLSARSSLGLCPTRGDD